MNRRRITFIRVSVAIVFIGLCLFILFGRCSVWEDLTEEPSNSQSIGLAPSDSIAIPGYEGITLKADTLKQKVCLSNPETNQCVFRITLCLEDGTVLWKSDEIKPGKTSKPIKLNQKLEKGTYPNAKLKYACFKLDKERTPLNGAETVLSLRVKE